MQCLTRYIRKILLILITIIFTINITGQKGNSSGKNEIDKNGFRYQIVNSDPIKSRIYKLKNGLTVYLSSNKRAPQIQTRIIVRAGSVNDPSELTGLAHYFEHIMFNGSRKIGALNWEKENPLIDSLIELFEIYRKTNDSQKKESILKEIDNITLEISNYSNPYEYAEMYVSMGSKFSAYTEKDITCYDNLIPSNELEKWLLIEKERFENIVPRNFFSELERVYEEFNESQTFDFGKAIDALTKSLFPEYANIAPVIGKQIHLKNPSIKAILEFYNTYYVPENMAICMSGDLDYDQTIKLINSSFGNWNKKSIQKPTIEPRDGTNLTIKETNVFGQEEEFMTIGYKINKYSSDERKYAEIMNKILGNQVCGLLNENSAKQEIESRIYYINGTGIFNIYAACQLSKGKIDTLKKIIFDKIEEIKQGNYPNWMIQAASNEIKLEFSKSIEDNLSTAELYTWVFGQRMNWADYLKYYEVIDKVDKKEISEFAKKYFKSNYTIVYKRKGKDTSYVKMPKPNLSQYNWNKSSKSDFYKKIESMVTDSLTPEFVDFKKDLIQKKINDNLKLIYKEHQSSNTFNLKLISDIGNSFDNRLEVALKYQAVANTKAHNRNDLNMELYKLGIQYNISATDDQTLIEINGLNSSFSSALKLIEELFTQINLDETEYKNVCNEIINERENIRTNIDEIYYGLYTYITYGEKSVLNNKLKDEELLKIDLNEISSILKIVYSNIQSALYYGSETTERISSIIAKSSIIPIQFNNDGKQYSEIKIEKSNIYFLDYDIPQVWIQALSQGPVFNKDIFSTAKFFNRYFQPSLSELLRNDLSYTIQISYLIPMKMNRHFYSSFFIMTQADKIGMALDEIVNAYSLDSLPNNPELINITKNTIIKKISSERINNYRQLNEYLNNMDMGFEYDNRKDIYQKAQSISYTELNNFYKQYIKNQPYVYIVIGNKKDIDFSILKKLGEIKEITINDIFQY